MLIPFGSAMILVVAFTFLLGASASEPTGASGKWNWLHPSKSEASRFFLSFSFCIQQLLRQALFLLAAYTSESQVAPCYIKQCLITMEVKIATTRA